MPKCKACGKDYHRCSSCGTEGETYDVYNYCSDNCWNTSEENKIQLNIIITKIRELDLSNFTKVVEFINDYLVYDDSVRYNRLLLPVIQEAWHDKMEVFRNE